MMKKGNLNNLHLRSIIKEKRRLYITFFFLFLLLSSIFIISFFLIKVFKIEEKYNLISLFIYMIYSILFIFAVVFLIVRSIRLSRLQHLLNKKSSDTARAFDDIDSLSLNPNEIVSKNIVTLTTFILNERKISNYEKLSIDFIENKPFVFITKKDEIIKIDFDKIDVKNNTVYLEMIKENNELLDKINPSLTKKMCYNYFRL